MKVSLITWVWVKMESTTDYLFLLIVSISERLFSEIMDNIMMMFIHYSLQVYQEGKFAHTQPVIVQRGSRNFFLITSHGDSSNHS